MPPAWDRLLSMHRRTNDAWAGEIYDLEPSDSPSTIDIKSRCNIARLLVRAGRSTGRFANSRRLMIVGSGPAAIAAALDAARYGIPSYFNYAQQEVRSHEGRCEAGSVDASHGRQLQPPVIRPSSPQAPRFYR